MKIYAFKSTTAVFAVLSLAACGGSGSSDTDMMTTEPLYAVLADGSTQNLTQAFMAGATVRAEAADTTALELDFDNDVTTPVDTTFSLRTDGNGGIIVVNNGVETAFTSAQRQGDDGYEIEVVDESFFGVFGQSDTLQSILNTETNYSAAVSYLAFPENGDPTPLVSYNVLGARTAPDVAPTANTVYDGRFKIEAVPATDFTSFRDSRSRFRGDAAITVATDGTISGALTDITLQEPDATDRAAINGSILMSSASISDGAFSGTLTADEALQATALNLTSANVGTYAGRLYGPAADEIAGTLSVGAQTETGGINGVGFFRLFD